MNETVTEPDWPGLLRTWDRQQQGYIPRREELVTTMLDAIEAVAGDAPRVLDLGCGPGSISARLLDRFPEARAVAVDIDPLLMAIGRGALGDRDGRLQWAEADLNTDDWPAAVGDEPFDVAVSATALHWLSPARLTAAYRNVAGVLRPGGLLLNADRLDFDHRSPTCRRLSTTVTRARDQATFAGDVQDWQAWWDSLAGHPVLDPLLEARRHVFAEHDAAVARHPGQLTSYAFHAGALTEAGFHEIDTIWQDLSRRLLIAVR